MSGRKIIKFPLCGSFEFGLLFQNALPLLESEKQAAEYYHYWFWQTTCLIIIEKENKQIFFFVNWSYNPILFAVKHSDLDFPFMASDPLYTVWKFKNFPDTQFLCEINFVKIWDVKIVISGKFEHWTIAKIYHNQNSEPLKLPKMTFFDGFNLPKFDFT